MSSGKKSTRPKAAGSPTVNPSFHSGITEAIDGLHLAIDKLRMQLHLSSHPLDKIRLYEEINILKNELSELEKRG